MIRHLGMRRFSVASSFLLTLRSYGKTWITGWRKGGNPHGDWAFGQSALLKSPIKLWRTDYKMSRKRETVSTRKPFLRGQWFRPRLHIVIHGEWLPKENMWTWNSDRKFWLGTKTEWNFEADFSAKETGYKIHEVRMMLPTLDWRRNILLKVENGLRASRLR